jgi:uncharacterized RDD family membrane protein YckC
VSVAAPRAVRPAGFWIRAGAFVLDAVVVMLAQRTTSLIAAGVWGRDVEDAGAFDALLGLFTLLFTLLYTTVLYPLTGQTIGKMIVGVRVVGVEGELLTSGAAFLRWIAWFASAVPFMLGFVMAGLRRDKRALHDLIAGSRVERLPGRAPATAPPEYAEPPMSSGIA